MTRYHVTIRHEAESDLGAVVLYYAQTDDGLAERFLQDFRVCVGRLTVLPRAGRLVYRGIRRVVLDSFPYNVLYRVVDARVSLSP